MEVSSILLWDRMPSFIHPALGSLDIHHVLGALSDPVRLQIVRELSRAECGLNCTHAASPFGHVPKSTLSSHFRVLRETGLIATTKRGVENINVLRREEMDARFPGLLDKILELASD